MRTLSTPLRAVTLAVGLALGGCSNLPERFQRFEIPENESSFRTRVYAGAAVGNAHLKPDTGGTVFRVDDGDDAANQLRLGVDVHNLLAAELDTSVLGAATLRDTYADVSYSAAALSGIVYGSRSASARSRRVGWNPYGRVGLAILKRSSQAVDLDESGTVPLVGIGAEYGFDNGLGIRAEITRFDEDAVFAGVGAVYRFGMTPRELGGMLAEAVEPALGSRETRVADGGRVLSGAARFGRGGAAAEAAARAEAGETTRPPLLGAANPADATVRGRWRPAARADDADRDGVRDALDRCPETRSQVTVGIDGCGLFDRVLADVTFKSGSYWLTARARGALDDVARRLLAFPEVRVRVLAHTDSTGPADANLALSARRAESVVGYLQSRDVGELQLEARGLGETRPIASNRSAAGRARNRRVELVTLSNLDEAALARHSEAPARDDSNEPQRWLPPPRSAVRSASAATSGRGPGPWRNGPPAPDAVSAEDAAERVGELFAGRPAPLPAPGIVPGLAIAGVIEGVGFAPGSTELEAGAAPALERVAAALEDYPGARIALMAHTDNRGDAADNLALSQRRAEVVRERLIALGIAPERLVAEGYGETLPLAQNVTEADRARNRRVEIRVLR